MFSRQSGKSFGTARGLGENTSCTIWSRTKLTPIVANSGAIRARPCSGRSPMRSIRTPTPAQATKTSPIVAGSGVCRYVIAAQPI